MVRVLVVDDEEGIASLFKDYLEVKGDHEIVVANSGFQALKELEDKTPDLIILDIVMPDLTGFEVVEAIRRRGAHVPIILSSITDGPSFEEKKRLGIVDFLRKPINFSKLNQLIEDMRAGELADVVDSNRRVKVLVIEDDEEELELIAAGLANMNCMVKSALTGERGLQIVWDWLPDIVVLDYMLPTMKGADVIKKIKSASETAHIPIVLISAYISVDYQGRLFVLRENDSEKGPLSLDDLCAKIKEISLSK